MIHLELAQVEKEMLIDILENDLSDLRMEIADTDSLDFREMLTKQKEVLKKVLETLRQARER
ncbi:MAG: hypothetical protein HZA47_04450 [Planctomycetes bacterium]|uniref:hypothetical protein n=1 Tax=Candidatus Wunengus sp. YC65 TaxID=3367701 RepID=UPI001E1341B0|nr:hypothetical protein [Planctomycetota bacterium]